MKGTLTLALIMCLGLASAALGQTDGEDYTGLEILEKQAAHATDLGPFPTPYPPNPYPPVAEGPPMAGKLLMYQANLEEFLEQGPPQKEIKKQTVEPTPQERKEAK